MNDFTILLADDDQPQREMLSGSLKNQGYNVFEAGNGIEALEIIKSETVDLLLTDLRMPELDGVELLKEVHQLNPLLEVIVMTAFGTVEVAVEAMQNGAYNFITKPVDLVSLKIQIERALEHKLLKEEVIELKARSGETTSKNLIAKSEEMREVLGVVARVASSKASVLILGESGTGKEMIARAIHDGSPRSDKPFVAVNIAAIPETLIESELFGHEKGSFTGAATRHIGRFERASGGTLFIDEIGDMPLQSQVKLLRVLQEGKIERVGGDTQIPINIRVVAATHRNLDVQIKEGEFREDLFYRLNVVRLTIPPLRERKTDIPSLVEHFIKRYSRINEKEVLNIDPKALDSLMKYSWPGNVRELENCVESALVLTRNNIIGYKDLPMTVRNESAVSEGECFPGDDKTIPLPQRIDNFEKYVILSTLEESGGNRTETARRLGMSDKNIRDRLKRWGIS
jgi:DNA-binding NtrC family response regulator